MVKPHTSQAVASISDPDRSEQMGANRNSPRNNPIIAPPNTTCPCGNPIILDGLVVKAHWEGKVCQDCESEMFKKHEARFRGAFGPRPVENSELREALDELQTAFDERYVAGTTERNAKPSTKARKRVEELFASLQQENERLLTDSDNLTEAWATCNRQEAEISRLRAERTEIAQEFGVSTDFDLGEHARVVMASLDDFKAELSRLRAIGEVR